MIGPYTLMKRIRFIVVLQPVLDVIPEIGFYFDFPIIWQLDTTLLYPFGRTASNSSNHPLDSTSRLVFGANLVPSLLARSHQVLHA